MLVQSVVRPENVFAGTRLNRLRAGSGRSPDRTVASYSCRERHLPCEDISAETSCPRCQVALPQVWPSPRSRLTSAKGSRGPFNNRNALGRQGSQLRSWTRTCRRPGYRGASSSGSIRSTSFSLTSERLGMSMTTNASAEAEKSSSRGTQLASTPGWALTTGF